MEEYGISLKLDSFWRDTARLSIGRALVDSARCDIGPEVLWRTGPMPQIWGSGGWGSWAGMIPSGKRLHSWKTTIFDWMTHTWSFSIAMLNYQRVTFSERETAGFSDPCNRLPQVSIFSSTNSPISPGFGKRISAACGVYQRGMFANGCMSQTMMILGKLQRPHCSPSLEMMVFVGKSSPLRP